MVSPGTSPPTRSGAARSGSKRPARLVGAHFAVGARRTTDGATPRLMMAIPKKLVPSSPVRNLIRRVIRESHRATLLGRPGLHALSLRIQLVAVPQDPASPPKGPDGRPLRPFARRPTDGALRRLVRAELDGLLARVA
ncbi:MAG: ribonuclease P protein component [Burkholderiales bacterium]|nr:ribonuclease P protein component [Burkholderiales bacterium]